MHTLVMVALGVLAVESVLSLWGGLAWFLRPGTCGRRARGDPMAEAEDGRLPGHPDPSVLLVVPCKGREPRLEEHLRSLMQQDWRRLEVRLVTATADDPAVPVVRSLLEEAPGRVTWHVAGLRPGCSEKAGNLVGAIRAGLEADVLVTADSDGRVDPGWLRRLLSGLPPEGGRPGAATGYRWYVAGGGAGGWLLSAWNAAGLSVLAADSPPFVWGGATALRAPHLEALEVLERWTRTASDDLSLTRALREAGGSITFVPGALVVSRARADVSGALAWIRRQLLLTRVYAPRLWGAVVGYQTIWTGSLVAGLFVAPARPAAGVLVAFVLVASMVKGGLRHATVRRLLAGRVEMSPAETVAYALLAPTFGPLTALCGLAALNSRRLTWRGVTYELAGPEQTVVVARGEAGGE